MINDIGIIKVHHIGYFVKDIRKSWDLFSSMGYQMQQIYMDMNRNIKLAFGVMGDLKVELVESLGESSPVEKMKQDGTRPYHICYEVDDIEESLTILRKKYKSIPLNEISKSTIEGKRVVHLYNKHMGIFELIER